MLRAQPGYRIELSSSGDKWRAEVWVEDQMVKAYISHQAAACLNAARTWAERTPVSRTRVAA